MTPGGAHENPRSDQIIPKSFERTTRTWSILPAIVLVCLLLWGTRLPMVSGLSGPAQLLRLLVDVIGTLAVLSVLVGLGSMVLHRSFGLNLPFHYLVASFIVGTGLLGGLLLLAGLVGVLSRNLVIGLVLVTSLVGSSRANSLRTAFISCAGSLRRLLQSPFGRLGFLVHLLFGALVLASALAPTQDWDSLMYHLTLPKQFLEAGRVFVPDDNLHVAFIGPSHMIHMVFDGLSIERGPTLLAATSLISIVGLVGATAASVAGRVAALTGSLLVWSMTGLVLVGVTAGVDSFLVLALGTAGALLYLAAINRIPKLFTAVWLIVGIAVATKYTAGPFVAGLLLVTAVLTVANGERSWLKPMFLGSVAGLLLWSVWLMKNHTLLGGSFYPFFTPELAPAWLSELTSGGRLDDSASEYASLIQVRQRFSLVDWFVRPHLLTVEAVGSLQGLSIGLVGAALLSVRAKNRLLASSFGVLAITQVAGVYLASSETNLRYFLPVVPPLAILAGVGLSQLWSTRPRYVLVALLIAGSIAPTAVYMFGRIRSGDLAYAVGAMNHASWSGQAGNEEYARLVNTDNWLSSFAFERTLFLFEAREGVFEQDVIQDILLTNWPLLAEALGGRCLPMDVADSLAVNEASLNYYVARGLDKVSIRWNEFESFAERCLEFVDRQFGYALYSIKR